MTSLEKIILVKQLIGNSLENLKIVEFLICENEIIDTYVSKDTSLIYKNELSKMIKNISDFKIGFIDDILKMWGE